MAEQGRRRACEVWPRQAAVWLAPQKRLEPRVRNERVEQRRDRPTVGGPLGAPERQVEDPERRVSADFVREGGGYGGPGRPPAAPGFGGRAEEPCENVVRG